MDHALRQIGGPVLLQKIQISFRLADKTRFHPIGTFTRKIPQRPPVGKGQAISATQREISASQMHMGKSFADSFAMLDRWAAHPHAFEKSNDRSRPSGELADCRAVATDHRLRTFKPAAGQMLHQAEKERQVFPIGALFIKRQDERARSRVQKIIGVLHPFRDAFVRCQCADIILLQEEAKLDFIDIRIDGHAAYFPCMILGINFGMPTTRCSPLTNAMSCTVSSTSRISRFTRKFPVSTVVSASSIFTLNRALKASMISSTMISGAEAPADRPTTDISSMRSHSMSAAR